MTFEGGCHCGSIAVAFTTAQDPTDIDVRACQCSFCRKHNALVVSDPDGQIVVTVNEPSHLSLYAFGPKTAQFAVCRRCGVYVAAVTSHEPLRAIVQVNALVDRARFTRPPRPMDFDGESRDQRIARRQSRWTPAVIRHADR